MNELVITLESKSPVPLYEQIYNYIKNDIQEGKLVHGHRLPSSRKLSNYLEVSRSTVELAYEQLISEGYVDTIPYKGYYVADIEGLYQFAGKKDMKSEVALASVGDQGEEEDWRYDFTPNGIDLQSFPYNAWRKITKNILLDGQDGLFAIGEPQGELEFRKTLCDYLHQARGMNCQSEQIVIGAGNEYLLMLLSIMFGNKKKIAFENPTYKRAYQLFGNLSYEVCTAEMDASGMMVEELEQLRADMAYVMPSHQYPLGIVMPIKRRLELLNWAAQNSERYIIEDDYDSEFRYKGKPIPALQGYDTEGKVIYLGTFYKSIAPAIRMSYMVLPKQLVNLYHEKCGMMSTTVSKIDQMIVNQFMKEGHYERHLNKSRAIYKGRHDTLLNCLKPLLIEDECKVSGERAGVHILLEFADKNKTESWLVEQARNQGVKVYGLSGYYTSEQAPRNATVILGYANLTEEEIEDAVAVLCKIWR